jgi:hypothetical protein
MVNVVNTNLIFLDKTWQAGNEAQHSDCMELPKDSENEGERHVVRQVEAVTALRFVPACHATE